MKSTIKCVLVFFLVLTLAVRNLGKGLRMLNIWKVVHKLTFISRTSNVPLHLYFPVSTRTHQTWRDLNA